MPRTDIAQIKETAIDLLYLEPTPNEFMPMFANHPYFESQMVMKRNGEFVDIYNDKKGLKEVQRDIAKAINSENDIYMILHFIRTPYHFTFLKFIKPYLDKHVFDKLLAEIWVNSENPNQDVNVDISTFIRWFKKANKRTLMDKKEYAYYSQLPEEVNVYRGVAVGRAEGKGLSWTCNYDTARWFAKRFDTEEKKGYILKGTIKKEDIFAYFNSRNEDEICCDSSKVYDLERI